MGVSRGGSAGTTSTVHGPHLDDGCLHFVKVIKLDAVFCMYFNEKELFLKKKPFKFYVVF